MFSRDAPLQQKSSLQGDHFWTFVWHKTLIRPISYVLRLEKVAKGPAVYGSLPSARQVMVIVWKLRGNIIRTALWWLVWHNVHSQHHTYVSSSYRSNRLGLSHWDPYGVHRGGCLELYYCNMVEWFWWDSSLISTTSWFPWVLWHCWFGHLACKNRPRNFSAYISRYGRKCKQTAMHFKCTDYNSSTRVTVYAECIYVFLSKSCPRRWIPCWLLTDTAVTSAVTNFRCIYFCLQSDGE